MSSYCFVRTLASPTFLLTTRRTCWPPFSEATTGYSTGTWAARPTHYIFNSEVLSQTRGLGIQLFGGFTLGELCSGPVPGRSTGQHTLPTSNGTLCSHRPLRQLQLAVITELWGNEARCVLQISNPTVDWSVTEIEVVFLYQYIHYVVRRARARPWRPRLRFIHIASVCIDRLVANCAGFSTGRN